MQKKADIGIGEPVADHARKKKELIIVNPNHVVRPDNRLNNLKKPLIGPDIVPEIGFIENGKGWKIVE